MAGYSAFDVQKAIDAIISSDITLLALLGTGDSDSIYDNPGQVNSDDAEYPFIVYLTNTSIDWSTKTYDGSNITITLATYSRTGDKEEASNILKRLHALLHNATLSVTDNNTVLIQWDGLSEINTDDTDELVTIEGLIRFRILTTQT